MTSRPRGTQTNEALTEKRELLALADAKESTIVAQQALMHEHGIAPRWEHWKELLMSICREHPGLIERYGASDAVRLYHQAHEINWRESFNRDYATIYPLPLPTPRVVKASNLALRFYVADGWYLEELKTFLESGVIECAHPQDVDAYFILNVGGHLNVDTLLERTSELRRAFEVDPSVSDREYMIDKMW